MCVPIENVIAAFPPTVKVGRFELRPLSIGGAIRLAEVGVDVTKTPVPKECLFAAAFVLSGATDYRRFLRSAKCGLSELANAVENVLGQAFSTRIPPMPQKDVPAQLTPSGIGWPLELAESLCAEYGWTFDHVLDMPLCRAFALQASARIRHGGKHGGPDYVERTLEIVKNSVRTRLTGERRRRQNMGNEVHL